MKHSLWIHDFSVYMYVTVGAAYEPAGCTVVKAYDVRSN